MRTKRGEFSRIDRRRHRSPSRLKMFVLLFGFKQGEKTTTRMNLRHARV